MTMTFNDNDSHCHCHCHWDRCQQNDNSDVFSVKLAFQGLLVGAVQAENVVQWNLRECQVIPGASCRQVILGTRCQVIPGARCQVIPGAKCQVIPGAKCQVIPGAR